MRSTVKCMAIVPEIWQGKAYPSLKPLSAWIDDLLERCKLISKWIAEGVPAVIWISGFNFPQAFWTGTLQNFARKHRMAIKGWTQTQSKRLTRQPESGCYIRGLYLKGARWDSQAHLLTESRTKELLTDCLIIWLKPTHLCPVYKTLVRAYLLVTTLSLRMGSGHPECAVSTDKRRHAVKKHCLTHFNVSISGLLLIHSKIW
ncbi:LOW QUALITY PROTEIN: hypothetical protein MARPO_0032s0058 [Marchantia polymorpha]|uniref:Dynein heavy chain C-terminal domain-containing protein n=1 Tax=Marchantia polymorpha TaxID=3197 RepID=A0A2R6X6Z6_MARPO|nr:LOW QUALITY PROTEIN: hypothetical protein MARPO_0032s0058 [Marchantia polymorpha]|eukprot:PTQ41863.1 LOW QUALITY PROTEIN: hypothetical protein MARPO_0032s0058 [Marchantia polymorpha]